MLSIITKTQIGNTDAVTFQEIQLTMAKLGKVEQPSATTTLNENVGEMGPMVFYQGFIKAGERFGLTFATPEAMDMLKDPKKFISMPRLKSFRLYVINHL